MNTSNTTLDAILSLFVGVPDPRVPALVVYPLEMLLFCALCSFICNGHSFVGMHCFARAYHKELSEIFGTTGIPSHDTFTRLFARMDGKLFADCLTRLAEKIGDMEKRHVVAFDGKTSCGARDKLRKAAHIVSAWSTSEKLFLKLAKVDDKSNEITAVPELLIALGKEMLAGTVVTADAMNCQKKNTEIITELGADYVLSLKGNHKSLLKPVQLYLDHFADTHEPGFSSTEKVSGRVEERFCWQSDDVSFCPEATEWTNLKSICVIERRAENLSTGKTTIGRRYFISSLPLNPEEIARCVRAHWGIENGGHWVLDVDMQEDYSRARVDNSAFNLRTLRSITMNILTNAKQRLGMKESLSSMRYAASLSKEYFLKLLGVGCRDTQCA